MSKAALEKAKQVSEVLEKKMEEEKKMENPVDLRAQKKSFNRANTAKNKRVLTS